MDPNKLLREIIEHVEGLNVPGVWSAMSDEERQDARAAYAEMCADLHDWLTKGGFLPDVAPLAERGKRMADHVGYGSIFASGNRTREYAFLAPLPYPVPGEPEQGVWRFVVYDGRGRTMASYRFPAAG